MAGRRSRPNGPNPRGRHLVGVTAVLFFASVLVGVPSEPAAHAALNNLTNFEIDGNTVVNGTPPGAGVDWANSASFLQDVAQPLDPCGVNPDPTTVTGAKLDAFDPFAPNPHPANINAKNDLCQGYIAWEPVEVTSGSVTSTHFVLYGGWRREVGVTGDMSFFIPLIGGPTKSDVTFVQFDYNPPAETLVGLLQWNGTSWVPKAAPANAFQSAVEPVSPPSFGEFAIDLTAAGVLPATGTCASVVSTYVMTRPGNGNADLADYVSVPPVKIANCSPIRIDKTTTPAISNGPVDFTYTLDRTDGGPVQDSSPLTPPNTDSNPSNTVIAGTLSVPTSPTDVFANIFNSNNYRLLENPPPPAPWMHQSIVCNYFDPTVLDANLKATPATATLTNPDGSWSGQTFTVAPTGLLPAGVLIAATCTISNRAPSLTLVKQVVNSVGNAAATSDMWTLSATPTTGPAVAFGPGTTTGVTKPVAASTYTLAETTNAANPPPPGYSGGPWSCTNAGGNPVTVTGGNQVVIGATDDLTCTITNTADDLARLTLRKVVVGGTAGVGDFTLSATQGPTSGSIDGNPISGVTGAASVTSRHVKRGLFSLSETGPPGYVPSWVCVDASGTIISSVSSVRVPAAFTNPNQLVVTCTVTNRTTAISVNITGSAANPAGTAHTFRLTATRVDTGAPLPNALFDLTFSNTALVTANTCQTAPGTDANGQCTVTVNSNAAGTFVITVNGLTNEGPGGPLPGQPFVLPAPVSSSKTWVKYRVEADSSINLVGDTQHTFTLRGFRNDGTGETPMLAGTVLTYTWSGAAPASPPSQCTVDASGTCAVTVTAATTGPENGTLTVTGVSVTLPDGTGNNVTYIVNQGSVALINPLPAVTKNWIAFRVRVEPSSKFNLAGTPHTFTVTAEYSASPGVWQPVNGGTVGVAFASAVAAPDPSSTCPTLSAAGTCTVTVIPSTPAQPGIGVLQITGLSVPGVTIGGQTTTITEPIGGAALDLSAATARKTWVLVDVAITQGVDNLAGEPHTFTVQVTGFDGEGPFPDGTGVPDAIVASSVVSAVGGASITGDTCATGTDASGQCTITVSNTGSGSIVVQLDQVTVTIDGTPFVINLIPGARGLPSDAKLPIRTDKVWWQYRVVLSNSAVNPLGVNHTFIATVQRTNDGGTTWQAVPDGARLDFVWIDPKAVSQVLPSSTCTTTGTVGGTCTFVVSSAAATTGTLNIRGIIDTFLDRNRNGLSGAPTDPVPDPDEFANEIVDIPASDFGAGPVLTARKTWWDFTVDVSGPAENPVGTNHTFTLTVRFSDGGALGFRPIATGTTMTYAWTGPAGSGENTAQSSCDPANGPGTNVNGQCTVVITSPTVPGTGTLTITGINSTTIPQPTRQVSFTFPTPGKITTKTWIAYRASISPSATNLAGTSHTFTITAEQNRGSGFVPVDNGTKLALNLSNPAKLVSTTCTVPGTVSGNCTVTVNSSTPGSVTVTPGAMTVSLLNGTAAGARSPVTMQPGTTPYPTPSGATKTWIAYAVTVTTSAINPVGRQHNFVITATVNNGTTTTPATGATITYTWTGAGTLLTSSPCTTSASGTCTVSVVSPTAGTGTLTVTSLTTATGTVDLTTAGAVGQAAGQTVPLAATKTWLQYRVLVDTSAATNLVGQSHTFTATVQQTGVATPNESDWTAVPNGTTLTASTAGTGTLDQTSTCLIGGTTAGTCTFDVQDSGPGTLTLTVTAIASTTVEGAPFTNIALTTPATASKTWASVAVSVTPLSATNLVRNSHTFTVHVDTLGADGTTPQPAVGAKLTWNFDGPGIPDAGATTCNPIGTDVTGDCDITFTNDGTPGSGTLTITSVTLTVNGATFTVDLTASGPGQATPPPITATKSWVAYAVTVTAAATNPAGRNHQFTIAATRSDGVAVAGATIVYSWSGTGTAAPPSQCTTSATGTCIVTVSSAVAGTGTLSVTSITDSAGAFVDLTTSNAPGQAAGQVVPPTTTKTWLQYRVLLDTTAATNLVGQSHTFTATVQQTGVATPNESDWTAVPNGTTLTVSTGGVGILDPASTCLTGGTTAEICTLVVHDAGPGTLNLTVTAIGTTTISGTTFSDIALSSPATTSKTWLSVAVSVTPPTATNLVGQSHTFTVHVDLLGADGTATPQRAPDETTVTWTVSGIGTPDPAATTCTTPGTTAGTCTITLTNNGTVGTATLTITSATVTVNGTPFTVDLSAPGPGQATPPPITATKSWGNYRVTVTPPAATNYVGRPHTFTVLVEHDTGNGFEPLAGAPVTLSASGTAVPNPPIPTSCTTGTTGTCAITTTSAVPGTLSLTATYDAASDAESKTFTGTAEKQWIPGWTLNIVKASSVTDSSQLFAFQTDGPAPLNGGSFSLAIGQSQLYEGLLPGTYTIAELTDAAHLLPPWRLESLACTGLTTGATVAIDGAQATLTLAPPNPGSAIICTYTNERMNLFVHKTDGGATAKIGGPPINYTVTVGNNGSVATTDPITVTDTLPAGLAFAGSPQVPTGGSCAAPVGQVLTCTLTAPIAPGASVQIIVPARALANAPTSVVNVVKIDSSEDVLCPDGTCPPPPECPEPTASAVAAVRLAAITVGGDASDNQACVRTPVAPADTPVGPEAQHPPPPPTTVPPTDALPVQGLLPRTGSSAMPIAFAGLCIIWGAAATLVARRRRTRRSV